MLCPYPDVILSRQAKNLRPLPLPTHALDASAFSLSMTYTIDALARQMLGIR